MKTFYTCFISISMICTSIIMQAQIGTLDTNTCISLAKIFYQKQFCDTTAPTGFQLLPDTSSNNIWQIGRTIKFGVSSTRDSTCSMITDTLNPYPINNLSMFTVVLPHNAVWGWNYNYYFKFWHRFDTDSLLDGCWLEFSVDTGHTWARADSMQFGMAMSLQNNFNACQLYNNNLSSPNMDTLYDGHLGWSGQSGSWRYTALWLNLIFPIKPARFDLINAVRFVFKSDSIQTNRAGWTIQDLAFGTVEVSSLNEVHFKSLPIFPNPSSEGIFYIDGPSGIPIHCKIYDIYGRLVSKQVIDRSIDLRTFQDGLYYYQIEIDGQRYSGTLLKK
jgi:hypothetical protein